ncbi:MAG: ribose-5-phosphate isomerase RpiA [Pseudomonadota bacterium]
MSSELKVAAAKAAVHHVYDGIRLGIGTGSTAEEFVKLLAERVNGGLKMIGVPTSERTAALCRETGVPLSTLDDTPQLDVTIDGADEIGPNLALIKGGGGALLREKIVAAASEQFIVIADKSKEVSRLGAFGVPIEVNQFGIESTKYSIYHLGKSLGLSCELEVRREGDDYFVTDGGHLIVDASFGLIQDAGALDIGLLTIPGVVQHGLFLGMANLAYVASESGVEELTV